MELAKYPKTNAMQRALNVHRPDMPSCEEAASGSIIKSFLSEKDADGRPKMRKILEAKYAYLLEHPEAINLKELVGSVSIEERIGSKEDAGSALADLFRPFGDMAEDVQEVVPEGEGKA